LDTVVKQLDAEHYEKHRKWRLQHKSEYLGPTTVSFSASLGSDHAALLTTLYPSDSLTLTPPPAPTGYKPDAAKRATWIKTFTTALPYSALDIGANGSGLLPTEDGVNACGGDNPLPSVTPSPSTQALEERLHARIHDFDIALETANRANLDT